MALLNILILLCICLVNAKYEIINNEASKNIFHSDRQSAPIISPPPKHISNGQKIIGFHECAFEIKPSEIVDVYLGVIFGKKHINFCKNMAREDVSQYMHEGHRFINVDVSLKNKTPLIPKGFETKFESYELTVTVNGEVKITAEHYPGMVRALDTLAQLIVRNEEYDNIYEFKYTPISITDEPSYAYRGVMVDTAREYFYMDSLKQIIDGMMLGRLNVFHWHFSDDDSFPMYSKSYKDLTNYTAFSQNEIYKPDEVADFVNYAMIRGIRVIPEIEGPGHLNSLGFYPEFKDLIACFRNYTVENNPNGGPPYAPIDPTSDKTYEFLKNFMNDMADIFDEEIWHLGGDEVKTECWQALPSVQAFMKTHHKSLNELQQYYIDQEREILSNINSDAKAIYWYQKDNMHYRDHDILQYWGKSGDLKNELKSHPNNSFILSPNDRYYLDCGYTNQYGDHVWCGSMKSWSSIYDYNPKSFEKDAQAGSILGSEVCIWNEMSNDFDLPTKIFPKAGGMSFKHWNPDEPGSQGSKIEVMMNYQYRLKSYGIPVEKISMRYCEVHTHHCFGI